MGSRRLGRDRRALPVEGPRQVPFHDNCHELAVEFRYRLRYAVHGQRRARLCQPSKQSLLRKLLIHKTVQSCL